MPKEKLDGVVGYGEGVTRREMLASAVMAGAGIVLAPARRTGRSSS